MSDFSLAEFRACRRLLRVISACFSASSSCSIQLRFSSSSIIGLSNGELSRADRLLVLLGCLSASSSVSLETSLGSKSTCSTSLASVSLAGGGGLSEFRFSAGDGSLGFCPEGRSRDVLGLSCGVVKSSLFPRTFVVPRGRIARVLAVKVGLVWSRC